MTDVKKERKGNRKKQTKKFGLFNDLVTSAEAVTSSCSTINIPE
jgi:hypothetical protein